MIPLILRLKKQEHKNVALAQDIIIRELYRSFEKAVLHGGTAIWRCYNGNRFSEDVDVYMPKDMEKIRLFFKNLEKEGFFIEKKKIGNNSLFSNLKFNRTNVRFEAIFKKVYGILREYETAEGNLITVYTLSPEELINEKCSAYMERLKIRDIYDVFFLLRYVKNMGLVGKKISVLLNSFKNPTDESNLKVLITEGLVPEIKKMLEYIKARWENRNI